MPAPRGRTGTPSSAADRDRRGDVVGVAREDHAERLDRVHAGVPGEHLAGPGVEADLPAQRARPSAAASSGDPGSGTAVTAAIRRRPGPVHAPGPERARPDELPQRTPLPADPRADQRPRPGPAGARGPHDRPSRAGVRRARARRSSRPQAGLRHHRAGGRLPGVGHRRLGGRAGQHPVARRPGAGVRYRSLRRLWSRMARRPRPGGRARAGGLAARGRPRRGPRACSRGDRAHAIRARDGRPQRDLDRGDQRRPGDPGRRRRGRAPGAAAGRHRLVARLDRLPARRVGRGRDRLLLPEGADAARLGSASTRSATGARRRRERRPAAGRTGTGGPMLAANADGLFPYTPPTNLLYGLREALAMLAEEGLETCSHVTGATRRRPAWRCAPGGWRSCARTRPGTPARSRPCWWAPATTPTRSGGWRSNATTCRSARASAGSPDACSASATSGRSTTSCSPAHSAGSSSASRVPGWAPAAAASTPRSHPPAPRPVTAGRWVAAHASCRSAHAAVARTRASSPGRPTSWAPTGRPCSLVPAGR